MKLDRVRSTLTSCGSCNYCRDWCPMFIQQGSEIDSPGGKIRALRAYAEKYKKPPQELLDKLYCADCRKCESICPASVPVTTIWHDAKVEMLRTGGDMSENLVKVLDWLEKEGTPFVSFEGEERTLWAEDLELPTDAETAIFAGCMGSYWYPDQPEVIVDMLEELGVRAGYVPSEVCCGLFNYWAGDDKGFTEGARKNYEYFKKAGVKEIVTGCGGCFGTLFEFYPHFVPEWDIKITHSIEVLADAVKAGKLELGEHSGSYTFHDSCHLGRAVGIYDAPRDVIRGIPGIEFEELENSRDDSNCCGGFLTVLDPELSEAVGRDRVQEAVDLGVDGMITTCVSCHKNLSYCARDTDLEVIQLDDLVMRLLKK